MTRLNEEQNSEHNEIEPTLQNGESRTLIGQESERDIVPGASNNDDRRSSTFNDK